MVTLEVSESLTLDGSIDVSGGSGTNAGSAGGSGGSIHLRSKSFQGKGKLIADGGASSVTGSAGGGAGGRIAIHTKTFLFTGKIIHGMKIYSLLTVSLTVLQISFVRLFLFIDISF